MYNCLRDYGQGKLCGNAIPDNEESQKIFTSTGMCPSCYEEVMNEMHDPEGVAWDKLKKAFPGKYVTLKKEFTLYRDGEEKIVYAAYADVVTALTQWGEDRDTAMEAVDNLIWKMEEGTCGGRK